MATPAYSIYIDGKIHKAFPSGDSTTDRTEAEEMYDSLKRSSYSEGTKLELRVSSRGIERFAFLSLLRRQNSFPNIIMILTNLLNRICFWA